jgi:hypothetical protein
VGDFVRNTAKAKLLMAIILLVICNFGRNIFLIVIKNRHANYGFKV